MKLLFKTCFFTSPLAPWLFAAATPAAAQQVANLLKNGSFEGGIRYWYQANMPDRKLMQGAAHHGEYALRIEKGGVQSAAFLLENGKPVTLSFSARADAPPGTPATMGWQMTPCDRETAMKHHMTWSMRHHHPVPITTEWKRYSFTFTPNVPQNGLWPRPTYMVQLGDCDKPILIDAVTVAYEAGGDKYLPRRAVEVQVDCPDLPGFKHRSGNTLPKGATVRLAGSVSNPGPTPRNLTLRWQLFDYEGERALNAPVEAKVLLAPGKTHTQTTPVKLTSTGLVLARFSALENGQAIDSSDLPITSLPYPNPKNATKPDMRERFGGSFFGPHSARIAANLGMAWSRWYPHTKWQDHQPEGPDKFHWFDKELDILEGMGIASHLVMYGWPKWAMDEGKHPLPKDMRWKADDARWEDLSIQTARDKYIVESVKHYRGRAVVFEIENEPEFDGWGPYQTEYVKFTTRTARLIKQTDPKALVMVNNVYGIPSGVNAPLLASGAGKYIDIISWHDYHEGGLSSGVDMQRMKNRLKEMGCGHIEIWFNEGWAYTNTSVDEPALALTNHTAAQSTNAMVSSLAELTVNGQEKTIIFHTAYEEHGMSFWDYYGPGTMLWDFYDYPMPLVAAWNTLIHHIGLSTPVAWVRPPGANFCVFEDLRNKRGVLVAYADREAKNDVTLTLPFQNAVVEDCMGNAAPIQGNKLVLPKNGRPVFIYTSNKTPGKVLSARLLPLDRKNASFVAQGGTAFRLPPTWEGTATNTADGNPAQAAGKPIWKLSQVWPPDVTKVANYRPLVWRNGWWKAPANDSGDQPKAEMRDGALRVEFRAATGEPQAERIAALSFIAPQAGTYSLSGDAALKLWDGEVPVRLQLLHKTKNVAVEVGSINLARDRRVPLDGIAVRLGAGDELVLVPRPGGAHAGGDVTLHELDVSLGGGGATVYKLPQT